MKINELTKEYVSKKGEKVIALNQVSFSVEPLEFVAILGTSGCGKTTLLNCIGGFDSPTTGQVIMNQKNIHEMKSNELDFFRANQVGYFFQDNNLIENMTVFDNIALPLRLIQQKIDRMMIFNIMEQLSIKELSNRYPNEISAGQRQRVALARAMVKKPTILLADEPTGALDGKTAQSIMQHFQLLNQSMTIILVTHDEGIAYQYANRVIRLRDGNIISDDQIRPKEQNESKQKIKSKEVKPKLPFSYHLRLAFHDIFVKKVKNFLTILLTSIALMLVSFTFISTRFNLQDAYIHTVVKSRDISYLTFTQGLYKVDSYGIKYTIPGSYNIEDTSVFSVDKERLTIPRISSYSHPLNLYLYHENAIVSLYDDYRFDGGTVINADVVQKFGFEIVHGHLPEASSEVHEIVITKYIFDLINKFGYSEFASPMNSFSDIDGKIIEINQMNFKIVGVVDTKLDSKYEFLNYKEQLDELMPNERVLFHQFQEIMTHDMHKLIFFNESFIQNYYLPELNKKFTFQNEERIILTHESLTISRILSEIYNLEALNQPFYSANHNHQSYAYVSLSSLPNQLALLSQIDLKTDELIQTFVDMHFLEISNEFELNTGMSTKEDYLSYIVTHEINEYHPLMTLQHFRHLARIEIIPIFLYQNPITFQAQHIMFDQNTNYSIPVVGVVFESGFKYYLSESLYQDIVSNAFSGITHMYAEHSFNKSELKQLLTEKNEELLLVIHEPKDLYMHGLRSMEDRLEMISMIFFYAMIVLLVFTAILFYQLITTHIDYRTKDIGILKSLGVSQKDVLSLFIAHSLILSLISYVFHVMAIMLMIFGFNQLLSNQIFVSIQVYSIETLTIVLSLGIAIILPMISSIIPVMRLVKKDPVDVIRLAQRN